MAPGTIDLIETFVRVDYAQCKHEFYVDVDVYKGIPTWYIVYTHTLPHGEFTEFMRTYPDTHLQDALRRFYWQFCENYGELECIPHFTDKNYYASNYILKIIALLNNREDIDLSTRQHILEFYT